MKTSRTQKSTQRGSVMIVVMCTVAVSALVLGSYFMLVQNQSSAVARSQIWNSAVPVTEAGVEEALEVINRDHGVSGATQMDWTNSVAADGWSSFTNGVTTLIRRTVSGNNTVTVSIDINTVDLTAIPPVGPKITSQGNVPFYTVPFVFTGTIQPFLAAGSQNYSTTGTMGRQVLVGTVPIPLFTAAVITRSNFDMSGNNCTVDSFDSTMTNLFPGGIYNLPNRRFNGDIATDSGIIGDIHLGQGNIYGHVMTGPGTQQSAVQVGNNGGVGDATYQLTHPGQIEPGYWSGDFNVNITDVSAPGFAGGSLPAASNNVITLAGGNYTTGSDPGKPLVITGPTKLWVQGSMSAANGITISNGGSLILYLGTTNASGSDSFSGAGQTAVNYPGDASKLQIYGLPSLTTITFSGNAGWAATVYAPEADVSGKGGGSSDLDTTGAMIVNSVTLKGHWNFHYDEHLKASGPLRGWIANSWAEQRASN